MLTAPQTTEFSLITASAQTLSETIADVAPISEEPATMLVDVTKNLARDINTCRSFDQANAVIIPYPYRSY
jgi:hypothetical protein